MPTPVGPAPRDPDDPDVWGEWDDRGADDAAGTTFGWPTRAVALVIVVGIILFLVATL